MTTSGKAPRFPTTVDSYGNAHQYLPLPDGTKIRLPLHYDPAEFALPGNTEAHINGRLFALFDPSTRTGAILDAIGKIPYWTMIQPTTRAEFFKVQVPAFVANLELLGLLPKESG